MGDEAAQLHELEGKWSRLNDARFEAEARLRDLDDARPPPPEGASWYRDERGERPEGRRPKVYVRPGRHPEEEGRGELKPRHDTRAVELRRPDEAEPGVRAPLASPVSPRAAPAAAASPPEPGRTRDATARKRQLEAFSGGDRARSKRLFGGLVGHLKAAGRTLKKDGDAMDRRAAVERAAAARKLAVLRRESLAFAKHHGRADRYKELETRDAVLTDLRRTETALLHAKWAASRAHLRGFLRTTTEPSLCWLPAAPSPKTDAMLAAAAARVDGEIAASKRESEGLEATLAEELRARQTRREEARRRNEARFARPGGFGAPDAAPGWAARPAGDQPGDISGELEVLDDLDRDDGDA